MDIAVPFSWCRTDVEKSEGWVKLASTAGHEDFSGPLVLLYARVHFRNPLRQARKALSRYRVLKTSSTRPEILSSLRSPDLDSW